VPPCLSKLSRIIKLRHDCRKSPLLVLPLSLGSPAGELRARSTAKAQSAAGEEWRSFATVIEMSITGIAVRSRRTSEELLSRGTRTENQTSAIALPNSFHEIARYFRGAKPLGCPSSGSLCSSIVPRAGESTLRSLVLRAGSLSLSLSLEFSQLSRVESTRTRYRARNTYMAQDSPQRVALLPSPRTSHRDES